MDLEKNSYSIRELIEGVMELAKAKEFPNSVADMGQKLLWGFVELSEAQDITVENQEELYKYHEEIIDVFFYVFNFLGIYFTLHDEWVHSSLIKRDLNRIYMDDILGTLPEYLNEDVAINWIEKNLFRSLGAFTDSYKKGRYDIQEHFEKIIINGLMCIAQMTDNHKRNLRIYPLDIKPTNIFIAKLKKNFNRPKQYGQKVMLNGN